MTAQRDFELNVDMFYLIETLKVESYWSKDNFTLTLQNKDIPLLNNIERIVKNLGLNISKRILLKIRLKENTKKEEVKLYWKNKKLNFHIEKSPFDKNKVKAVTSLPYEKNYNIIITYKNKKIPIEVKCLKEKIIYDSEIDCWLYKDLRFPTKRLLEFLDKHCGSNKILQIEKSLLDADKKSIMSAFSALIDCEGSIDWYGFKRIIRIRMRDKNYLKQWSSLLKKYDIYNYFRKNKKDWEINIAGWEDFDKLEKMGFRLIHSKKANKWKRMMKGFKRNQISRGTYQEFYIKKLEEINRKITSKEFAEYIGKSKRVVNHYLSKLEREGLISRDKGSWPYLYFISTSSVR
ncbi:hypothetical protein CMI39_00045 [Candidatus Pacearchaeota archaeon]|jgi:hypothetical protein|nr:hypothetical protein [Candidatus Pacearchaeota archaeon]|tara:strand:+ start:3557 stop:4600 length:1044 start_codon:yes stop_codon:yes gene_type:complete